MLLTHVLRRSFALGLAQKTAALVLILHVFATIFEGLGVGMLLPVVQLIERGGNPEELIASSNAWQMLAAAYGAVGLELNLAALLSTSFACFLMRQVVSYARIVFVAKARHSLMVKLRRRAFELCLGARLAFHEGVALGQTVNDMTNEIDRATKCMFQLLAMYGLLVLGLFYLAGLIALSPTFTIAALVPFSIAAFSIRRLLSRSQRTGIAIVEAYQAAATFLTERLKSIRLVRLARTEAAELKAFENIVEEQRDSLVLFERLRARLSVAVEPIVVGLGFIVVYVGVDVFGLGLEEIGLFVVVILRLMPVMKELLNNRQTVLGTEGSFQAVERLYSGLEAAQEHDNGSKDLLRLTNGIEFDALTFAYDDARAALNGVDLTISAGSYVAIVGPSGGGKSTLIDHIPRLRRPQSGTIRFDGVDIREISTETLRRAIAYAPQTPILFNVPISEHIRYGRPEAGLAEVREAARLAGVADFIEGLPNGYETLCGEAGVKLSGGQKQRLDLARALAGPVKILILDEPTSNLDAESEAAFRESLTRIRNETEITIIVVGHRLSLANSADSISVMQDGRITETGTHEELIERKGWYARAYARQTGYTGTTSTDPRVASGAA